MTKIKNACWSILCLIAVCYTIFAIYCFTPLFDDPNAPQIYQMTLVDRYDASYQNSGKSKIWVVRYKGLWTEKETGKRLDLVINEYMMKKMPIGETVPMEFKPSTFGLVEDTTAIYKILPGVWLAFLVCFGLTIAVGWAVLGDWD